MAGLPKEGKFIEIGHDPEQLAGPVSLSSCCDQQRGPGPQQALRQIKCRPGKPDGLKQHYHAHSVRSVEAK
jgi:hypothetical protein